MKRIDLNCDMGEMPEAIADGTQESLMPSLTSVNIACGGHAGDAEPWRRRLNRRSLEARRRRASRVPDRANFGRLALDLPPKKSPTPYSNR